MKSFPLSNIQKYILFLFIFPSSLSASESITIDGMLTEKEWINAKSLKDFKVTLPLSLDKPNEDTESKIFTNDLGIYIGFINHQNLSDSTIKTTLHDENLQGDHNEIIIDFDGAGTRAFGFKIGRGGATQDSVWINENKEDTDWDGDWQHGVYNSTSKSTIKNDGIFWSSEFFIPWSSITMEENSEREIRVYFARFHQANGMRYSYPATDRSRKTFLTAFDTIKVNSPKIHKIDFFPYVRTSYDMISEKTENKAGIDIFWKLASNKQLNLALNPDFGQVESNELVVNFSALETFFTEKRPFFIENNELLDIRGPEALQIVHTPRIGSSPDAGAEDATNILAAGRYSHVGENINGSILIATEDDSVDAQGRDYLAARLQYKNSKYAIGFIQTETKRPTLSRDSSVSAIDYEADATDNLRFTGGILYTQTTESKKALTDIGWWTIGEYQPTDNWSHEFTLSHYGVDLELNDFGYLERAGLDQAGYLISYEWSELNNSYLRDATMEFAFEYAKNNNNQKLPTKIEMEFQLITHSVTTWEFGAEYISQGIDDLFTRGLNIIKLPQAYELFIVYETNNTNRFQFSSQILTGKTGLYEQFYEAEFNPGYQFGDNLNLQLGLNYRKSKSWLVWLENNDIGEFKQKEFSYSLNLSWKFRERHELRWKMESVSLNASIKDQYVANIDGLLTPITQTTEDFQLNEFAMQIRYRYEIGPLSEVFIVYGRGGEAEKEGNDHSNNISYFNPKSSKDSESLLAKIKFRF